MSTTNTVKWLIDSTYDSDTDKLIEVLQKQEKTFNLFTIKDFYTCFMPDPRWDLIPYDKNDNVFFVGSIRMAQKIQRYTPWLPGIIGDFKFVECVNYYPILREFLLNKEYIFTNIKILRENWGFYQKCLGEDIFVRPNTGDKIFTGGVYHDPQELFDSNQVYLNDQLLNTELAVLSKAVNIDAEYRYLVVDGKAITGSSYRIGGELVYQRASKELHGYVDEVACILGQYEPASIVDVAVVDSKPYVLEINTVSSSGLYDMDMNLYVESVEYACNMIIEKEEL